MKHNYHSAYRADIDGIRALAVLSVVAFHAFPESFAGGFIGVDVFFVISGFLISSIIFRSLELKSFSYLDFYIRRIRRIFPALILVLIVSALVGWFLLLPDEFRGLGKHLALGASFLANFGYWKEVSDYFGGDSAHKPLLHLWSLGVEEQYYILWPLLLTFIWKWSHNFLLVVLPILLFSFVLSVYPIAISNITAFYHPATRFWELMIGGLLAYIVLHHDSEIKERVPASVVSFIGFGSIILGLLLIDNTKPFPGWWAMFPTIGTFFMILAGEQAWINKFLSNRYIVFVGLISYPLYLWHWPLLVYGRFVGLEDVDDKLVLIITSFLLATLTYLFVEKPLRFSFSENIWKWLMVLMTLIVVIGLAIHAKRVDVYHNSEEIKKVTNAAGEWEYPGVMIPFQFGKNKFYRLEGSKLAESNQEVLFVGDSNMEQYYPKIEVIHQQAKKDVVFATIGGCIPVPNVHELNHKFCDGLLEDVIRYASKDEVKTIVIGALWFGYFRDTSKYYYQDPGSGEKFYLTSSDGFKKVIHSFTEMLLKFDAMGKQLYVILNIPMGLELNPKFMINRSIKNWKHFFQPDDKGLSVNALDSYRYIDDAIALSARKAKAIVIDPKKYLCDNENCPSVDARGEPIYKDANHLRPSFVRRNIKFLNQIFEGERVR